MFSLFDLLKNKIKSFTNKVLGKAKEKEAQEENLDKPIETLDKKPIENLDKKPTEKEKELLDKPTGKNLEPTSKIEPKKDSLTLEEDLLEKDSETNNTILEKVSKNIPKQTDTVFIDSKEDLKPVESKTDSVDEGKSFDSLEEKIDSKLITETKKETIKKDLEEKVSDFTEKKEDLDLSKINQQSKKLDDTKEVLEETEALDPFKKDQKTSQEKTLDSDLNIEKKKEIKKSLFTSLKGIFSNKIKLSEKEIADFLDEFELSLLEADVSIKSAEAIVLGLKKKLTDFSFAKENILEDIKNQIKIVLKEELNIDCNIENYFLKKKEDQPYIILFIGPNGVGKTTTIAKLAHKFKAKNKSVILASSDTFRAGSIDQLEKHASNIGVRIVKQNYGSDPAAVAYDAVLSAKANKTDYVLIDTAGRQETNHNLMEELKKIKRVVNPDLIIYIGEAQAGQAITEQIEKFDSEIGIDGVILTKIDTDPKGGVAISILNEFKKPIFFIGTGQEYENLEEFSADYIIERIV